MTHRAVCVSCWSWLAPRRSRSSWILDDLHWADSGLYLKCIGACFAARRRRHARLCGWPAGDESPVWGLAAAFSAPTPRGMAHAGRQLSACSLEEARELLLAAVSMVPALYEESGGESLLLLVLAVLFARGCAFAATQCPVRRRRGAARGGRGARPQESRAALRGGTPECSKEGRWPVTRRASADGGGGGRPQAAAFEAYAPRSRPLETADACAAFVPASARAARGLTKLRRRLVSAPISDAPRRWRGRRDARRPRAPPRAKRTLGLQRSPPGRRRSGVAAAAARPALTRPRRLAPARNASRSRARRWPALRRRPAHRRERVPRCCRGSSSPPYAARARLTAARAELSRQLGCVPARRRTPPYRARSHSQLDEPLQSWARTITSRHGCLLSPAAPPDPGWGERASICRRPSWATGR